MWSLFGELLCVTNVEHPLPYRWRIQLDDDSKRRVKMLNSLRIINEIGNRYPNFHIQDRGKPVDEKDLKREP